MFKAILKEFLVYAFLGILLYLNLAGWQYIWLNWLLFVFYFLFASPGGRELLIKFFNFSPRGFRTRVLGAFICFMTLGFFAGAAIVFYKLNTLAISAVFVLNGTLFAFLKNWARQAKNIPDEIELKEMVVVDEMPTPKIAVLLYLLLASAGFYLLIISRTGQNILSPWQTINSYFIYVFAAATLVLGALIFSRCKAKTLIFLLVVHSFLLHSYLPLTHELFYGADGWRHIATESRIVQDLPLTEVVLSQDPAGFIHQLDIGRFSYSQLWGLAVILSRLLGLSLISVSAWLVPVLWSIIFPILLFEFARSLGWEKKTALFFSWLGFLPFALQAAGSFTLPVDLSFLWWLLLVILFLKRFTQIRVGQVAILVAGGLFSFFGYTLYFILFWWGWLAGEMLLQSEALKIEKASKPLFTLILSIYTMALIPIVEFAAKFGVFSFGSGWLAQVRQLIGNFSGWYLAAGPRPHDIITGNILINQIPSYAFVSNIFTLTRWWLPLFTVLLFAAAVGGWIICFRKRSAVYLWISSMAIGIWGSYIIGNYFMVGERVLSRRLDAVCALFFLVLLLIAIGALLENKIISSGKLLPRIWLALAIIIISFGSSAVYSMGPDTNSVSSEQYNAMNFIWSAVKDDTKHCVLSDTYPLLALEAISAKRIVGGGFPINEYFAQPELSRILEGMKKNPSPDYWKQALYVTGADKCYFVGDVNELVQNDYVAANAKKFVMFGKTVVWEQTR